ncbi:hypothetical protein [Fluviispira multicolorata]|uniref:Uncharacterized protein n=1 Tax=Fluviispira multicolorata TaxID=2654512 RepID=A0A833JCV0_9BACT|nr:hypothetical protein [Fluviispira multicolorata]KAB8030931.1 hypothetical protein GCL57_08135 [Fluviispira multicolorata]
MNDILGTVLFSLSGVIIMLGIVLQAKATLDQGLGQTGFSKAIAMLLKYSGFALLAFLMLKYKTLYLALHLIVFFLSALVTFLLYLLARRASLR